MFRDGVDGGGDWLAGEKKVFDVVFQLDCFKYCRNSWVCDWVLDYRVSDDCPIWLINWFKEKIKKKC